MIGSRWNQAKRRTICYSESIQNLELMAIPVWTTRKPFLKQVLFPFLRPEPFIQPLNYDTCWLLEFFLVFHRITFYRFPPSPLRISSLTDSWFVHLQSQTNRETVKLIMKTCFVLFYYISKNLIFAIVLSSVSRSLLVFCKSLSISCIPIHSTSLLKYFVTLWSTLLPF